MNPISSLFKWLFNKNQKPQKVYRDINEELIEKDKKYKQLARKTASLEGELAREKASKIEKKEEVKKEEVQNEIAKNLSEQSVSMKKEEYGEFFSFKSLFNKLLKNKKFNEKFEISDMNDKVSWKFGDIGIFPNIKSLAVIDKDGNIRCISQFLSGVIHKPESIFNQVKRNRILIATDENGDYIQGIDDETDLEDYELPVPVFNEEKNKWEGKTGYKKKAREIIINLQEDIRECKDTIRSDEMSLNILRTENEDLERANEILLHAGKVGKSAVSEAMGMSSSLSMEMVQINMRIASLTENNVHLEKELGVWKNIAKDLQGEIEKLGNESAMIKAMKLMKQAREFERVKPIEEKEEKNNVPPVQPGQVVGTSGGKI